MVKQYNTIPSVFLKGKPFRLIIISCFHECGEKLALKLLYYLDQNRKEKSPKSDESKEILTKEAKLCLKMSKLKKEWQF